jgi:hypothetical protein
VAFLDRAARALPGERQPETPAREQARVARRQKAVEAGPKEARLMRRVRAKKSA